MIWRDTRAAWGAALVIYAASALPCSAQQPATIPGVVQVIGMTGIKEHAKGSLSIDNGNLQFANSKAKATVVVASIRDIVTGNDSQRVIRGTLGALTIFAPYYSGRFLSLFRSKLDTLTIEYVDSGGGIHGAVFTLPVGKADPLKKQLLGLGARTTIPTVEETKAPESAAPVKETKP